MTTVWWLWSIGMVGLVLRWLNNRGKYRNLEDLQAASDAGVPPGRCGHERLCTSSTARSTQRNGCCVRQPLLVTASRCGGDMGRLVEERDGLAASEPWFRMAAERGSPRREAVLRPGPRPQPGRVQPALAVLGIALSTVE